MKTICLVLVVKLSVAFLSSRESLLLTTIRQVSRSSVGFCPPLICSGGFPCFTIGLVFHHLRRVIISDEISFKFRNEFHSQIWDPGISNGGSEDRHMKFRSTFIPNPCSLFYLPAVSLSFLTNLQVWKQSGDNTLSPMIVSVFGNQVRILSYDDDAICKSWVIAISVLITAFDGFRNLKLPWILLSFNVLPLFFNCSIRFLSDLQNQHITWDKFFVGLSDRLRLCEGWCLFTSNSCPVELSSSVYLLRWKQSWGKELFNRIIQNFCRCELQFPQSHAVGSTAVVSVVTPEKIIVSNGGDSRAVICRKGVAIALSVDHKPDRPVLLCVWTGISRTKERAKVTFFCFIVFPKRITGAIFPRDFGTEVLVPLCLHSRISFGHIGFNVTFCKKKSQPKVAVHNL